MTIKSNAWVALRQANPLPDVTHDSVNLEKQWVLLATRFAGRPKPARPHRWGRHSLAVPLLGLLVLGTASTALATGYPQHLWESPAIAEDHVLVAANLVTDYDSAHPQSGYSNVQVSGATHTVVVFWRGSVPAGLRAHLAQVSGIRVIYRQARYSAADLDRATNLLTAAVKRGLFSRFGIVELSVGPAGDGSGVSVGYVTASRGVLANGSGLRAAVKTIGGVSVSRLFRAPQGGLLTEKLFRPSPLSTSTKH